MISNGNGSRSIPQGLKSIEFIGFTGTTEVVPFQSEQIPFPGSSFPQPVKPIDFIGFTGILRLRSGQARSRSLGRNKNASSTKQRQTLGSRFHLSWVGIAGGELKRS
jgi:hypothetical protein